MKSHVLPEAGTTLGRQLISFGVQPLGAPSHASGTGCGVAFKLTSNHEPSSITMGPSSHLPSPPTAHQPPMGETGSAEEEPGHCRERALGPFAAGQVSGHQHPRIGVERPDLHGDQTDWSGLVGDSSPRPGSCPFPGSMAVEGECDPPLLPQDYLAELCWGGGGWAAATMVEVLWPG